MMRRKWMLLLPMVLLYASAWGIERFPPPEFESGYQLKTTTTPLPRGAVWDWIDTGVLFTALCMATWLTLKKRSRKWIAGLMVFSLLYFGFWRHGCVCPVGSIGNIALAINADYVIPAVVLVFFLLPMIFTLFFGRGFCGAVCPLGAVQDLFVLKPMRLPRAVEAGLRLFAYLYLAAAVIMAATGTMFLICRYDPFVTLFRFEGDWNGWVLAGSFLAVSVFIARPYCRFVCPYGVLLRNLSRLSKWRVTITPDECIHCRLCENVCPFDAINAPVKPLPALQTAQNRRLLVMFIVLTPVIAAAGGWLGYAIFPILVKQGNIANSVQPLEMKLAVAAGVFMGLVAAGKLISTIVGWRQNDYEARRGDCLACGRCFEFCPRQQHKRNA